MVIRLLSSAVLIQHTPAPAHGQSSLALIPTRRALSLSQVKADGEIVGRIANHGFATPGLGMLCAAGHGPLAPGSSVNQMLIQPFINYNFPEHSGRYLSFSPIVTADWTKAGDGVWTVLLGLGVGQIFRIGTQSVNAQFAGYWNAVRPDKGASWTLRLQLQFLFPQ